MFSSYYRIVRSHWLAWVLVTAQAMQGTMMSSFSFGLIYTRLSRGKVYTLHYDHQHIRLVQLPFCSVIMPFFVKSTMNGTL